MFVSEALDLMCLSLCVMSIQIQRHVKSLLYALAISLFMICTLHSRIRCLRNVYFMKDRENREATSLYYVFY